MRHDEHGNQPLRELEWLAQYFREHSREDLAQEIFARLVHLRHYAQDSLDGGAAEVIDLSAHRRKTSGDQE